MKYSNIPIKGQNARFLRADDPVGRLWYKNFGNGGEKPAFEGRFFVLIAVVGFFVKH